MNNTYCCTPEFLERVAKLARAISAAESENASDLADVYIRGPVQLVDGAGDTDHGHLEDISDSSDWAWFPPEQPAPPPPRTVRELVEDVIRPEIDFTRLHEKPQQDWREKDWRDEAESSTPVETGEAPAFLEEMSLDVS